MFAVIDCGTTMTRIYIVDENQQIIASGRKKVGVRDTSITGSRDTLRSGVTELFFEVLEENRIPDKQVEFAIVETNGSISVQKKFEYESPTNEMTQQAAPPARQPSLPLIADGTILNENLHFLGVDLPWVEEQCRMRGFTIRDILLFLCNDAGQILVIPREEL